MIKKFRSRSPCSLLLAVHKAALSISWSMIASDSLTCIHDPSVTVYYSHIHLIMWTRHPSRTSSHFHLMMYSHIPSCYLQPSRTSHNWYWLQLSCIAPPPSCSSHKNCSALQSFLYIFISHSNNRINSKKTIQTSRKQNHTVVSLSISGQDKASDSNWWNGNKEDRWKKEECPHFPPFLLWYTTVYLT